MGFHFGAYSQFHDTDLKPARAERTSPVVSTEPSAAAKSKKAIKRNANGDRVNSFAGLDLPSWHHDTQHHAHVARRKTSLQPAVQIHAAPGGGVQAPRLRAEKCPVTEKANRGNGELDQALAQFFNKNFRLGVRHADVRGTCTIADIPIQLKAKVLLLTHGTISNMRLECSFGRITVFILAATGDISKIAQLDSDRSAIIL